MIAEDASEPTKERSRARGASSDPALLAAVYSEHGPGIRRFLQIRFVFKNSPLPFHEHARLAAKASLVANEQGKFWEYHDALYAHQRDLGRASLERYAEDLGLDLRRFRAALDDARPDAVVEADITEAHRLELEGTPSFFVNGRFVQGAQPLAAFRAKVDQALADR